MRTVIASLVFFFLSTVVVYSNDFTVNVTSDGNGVNQLRGAIAAAVAAGAGPHTINIDAGGYNLTMGQIILGSNPITITFIGAGGGNTVINMTNQNRIFLINPTGTTPNVNVTFQGITLTGGHLLTDNFGGGAILCGGPNNIMTLTDCVFSGNAINPAAGTNGGALAMEGGGTLTIDRCFFVGNNTPKGDGGALYYFLPVNQSGNVTITNCVFGGNAVTDANSAGGAIAIQVLAKGGSTTANVSIQKNLFIQNQANASGGDGGAIHIDNRFANDNIAFINFNRFAGNTATNTATSGIEVVSAIGNVDINNNWWGCNDGPLSGSGCNRAAVTGTGGTGALIAANWLQLSVAASAPSVCSGSTGNTATVTAGFLSNSAGTAINATDLSVFTLDAVPVSFTPSFGNISNAQTTIQANGTATATFTSNGTITLATVNATVDNVPASDPVARATINVNASPAINTQPSPHAVCSGDEVNFTVAASGASPSYAWFKGVTQLTNGQTVSGSVIAGVNTPTLTISNPGTADASTAYKVQVTASNGCSTVSGNTQLTIAPLTLLTADGLGNKAITTTDFAISDGSCRRMVIVQPSGTNPVSGIVNAAITIEAAQPAFNGQPYVKRHYDIAPSINANAATATITLYFLQSEFDSYNAALPGTNDDLPTGPGDATGRATQYHGVGSTPGTYSGWGGPGPATVLITPGGGNVNWNSTRGWWEVTFPVTGFSGFYVTGLIANALPVTLTQLTAVKEQGGVRVQWQVSREVGFSHYGIETSPDGRNYTSIGTVEATNNTTYSFLHNNPVNGINYYRLKLVDIDGNFTYSPVVSCVFNLDGYFVRVMNNPFRQLLELRIDAKENTKMQLQLTDQTGKLLMQKVFSLSKGSNTVTLTAPGVLAKGMYLLRIQGGGFVKTLKVVKGE
jgi:Immunoglobulin I-set domain